MSLLPINPDDFPDVPTRKALIAIDLQNDFLAHDGALPVTQPDGMVDKIVALADALRNSGYGDVVWVRSQFDASRPAADDLIMAADTPQIPLRPGSSAAAAAARARKPPGPPSAPLEADPEAFLTDHPAKPQCVRKGSKGADLFPAIAAAKGPRDYAMTKSYYSAFETGQLLNLLRRQFATELYICGALSNVSVYATALAASCYGFDITIVEDCCGYRSEMRHMNAARKLSEMTGCEFSTVANVLPTLRPKTPESPPSTAAAPAPPQIPPELIAAAMAATRNSPAKGIPVRPKPSEEEGKEERGETGSPATLSIDLPLPAEKVKLMSESPVPAKTTTLEPKDDAAQSKDRQAIQAVVNDDAAVEARNTAMLKRQAPKSDLQRRPSTDYSSDVTQTPSNATSTKPRNKSHLTDTTTSPNNKASQSRPPGFKVTEELLVAATPPHMLKGDYTRDKVADSAAAEPVCEGDTTLTEAFLPPDLVDGLFERLCEEVQFRKMMHQGGEVPRFIAVQGETDRDSTQPVYRHPADESPPLLPFTPAVQKIRYYVEKALEHPVNHVLIQCYRGGNDYISEHSDKTLDIVPGSYIANVSLGAERTMVFRTKRGDRKPTSVAADSPNNKRQAVRLPMPHNSLVKMGQATNAKWLHGIKADKRPVQEKTKAELAWEGVRISLTFRGIGTFLSPPPSAADGAPPATAEEEEAAQSEPQYIWGQGAVSKGRKDARPVLNGQTPEAIAMLKAFGRENNSPEFDWDANYGRGFDVLHMKAAPRYFGCGDLVVDTRVKLMLAECGVKYARGNIGSGPPSISRSTSGGGGKPPLVIPVKFVVDDPDRTTVVGDAAILLYLDAKHPKKRGGGDAETARVYTRFYAALALGQRWAAVLFAAKEKNLEAVVEDFFKAELAAFEAWASGSSSSSSSSSSSDEDNSNNSAAEGDDAEAVGRKPSQQQPGIYIAGGGAPSIADYALWPVLYDMTRVVVVSPSSNSLSTADEEEDNKDTQKSTPPPPSPLLLSPPFGRLGGHKGLDTYFQSFGQRKSVVEVFAVETPPPTRKGDN